MTTFQLCLLLLILWPQQPDAPLPDQASFMEQFRKSLNTPQQLLSQYTYTYKETEYTLDSKGKIKKTETNVYEVTHGAEEWQTYERQTTKNGVPLTKEELDKQDRKERERVDKETRKRAKWPEAKKREEKEKAQREERETNDDMFATFDYRFVRREKVGDASTILVNFTPKKNYKPKTGAAKALQHAAGRLWISEADHQLARLEAEIIEPLKIGAGLLAKLQKGSTLALELKKVNDEIWLPVKFDAAINGKILLLKGLNMRISLEFSDHKKFNVDTILNFPDIQ